MKMTEIQKAKQIKRKLHYQKVCPHLNIEQIGNPRSIYYKLFQCESCNKVFRKDEKWHGHTYEQLI
jgi:hypothetical protein